MTVERSEWKRAYYAFNQVLFRLEAEDGKPVFSAGSGDGATSGLEPLLNLVEDRTKFAFLRGSSEPQAFNLLGEGKRPFALVPLKLAGNTDVVASCVVELTELIARERLTFLLDGRTMSLISVAPDWLCGAVVNGEGIGSGGPATEPKVPRGIMRPPEWTSGPASTGCSCPVHVFVLDTVPTDVPKSPIAGRPRLFSVDKPNSTTQLTIKDNQGFDITNRDLPTIDKDMPEHGTFVANIIQSIAPCATIHLVQVLNEHGIGTVGTIAAGMQVVRQHRVQVHSETPCLVNCSFVIAMPVTKDPKAEGPNAELRAHPTKDLESKGELTSLDRQARNEDDFRGVFSASHEGDKWFGIVAASGNDSEGVVPPYMARYPARLDNVLGVGALTTDKIPKRADYSNAPDNLVKNGLMALGEIVGPFVRQDGVPDTREWSGTSFATPIITGLLARLMGEQGYDFESAVKILRRAESGSDVPITPNLTAEVVTVTQE